MKKILCVVLALLLAVSAAGCANVPKNQVYSAADLPGKSAGVLAGSQAAAFQAELVREGASVIEFDSADDLMQGLLTGTRVDCVVTDADTANALRRQYKKTKILDEGILDVPLSAVVARENVDLTKNLNAAFAALTEDGTISAIEQAWISGQAYESVEPSGETGITLAVADCMPYAHQEPDGTVTGMDADIARAVCAWLGIGLEITVYNQEELIEKVRTGRADFAMGCLSENEEDAQLVDFTDPYMNCHQVIVVRKK